MYRQIHTGLGVMSHLFRGPFAFMCKRPTSLVGSFLSIIATIERRNVFVY